MLTHSIASPAAFVPLDRAGAVPAGRGPDGDPRPHAVIIGSGFGGLAAAVRLGARGYRVTVLEKLDAPGGRGYVHRRDGFTFDAGPTVITAPFLFEELWQVAGRKLSDDVELVPIAPFYRVRFDDGSSIDYSGDPAEMRREIARFSPADVAGYERFLQASKDIFAVGFTKLAHVPIDTWPKMLRCLPDMARLQSWRTVYGLASRYVKEPRLRMLLTFQSLLVGGNPFSTTSVYCLIAHLERKWGVHFAMGGTGALVTGLVGLIEGQGGRVICKQAVAEITVKDGAASGVRMDDGRLIAADVVVSNCDSAWTYRHLLAAQHRKRWTDAKIERAKYSMSLFVWYFGTRKRFEDVAHHTIVLGPRYRELITDIFDRKRLSPDCSLYLHRPTKTDFSLAPPGCDAFYVLSPVPHLQGDTDWATHAETYRRLVEKRLHETVLPGLADAIVTSLVTTPQDFQDRLNSFRGAAFGLAPELMQSAWFRPHNQSEEIARLYLVGAGTHPGAGLPGVLSSAKILDTVVPHAHALRSSHAVS